MRQGHAQTLSKKAKLVASVAEIRNKQWTRIDKAREACKGMALRRECNITGEQMKWSSFCATLLTSL